MSTCYSLMLRDTVVPSVFCRARRVLRALLSQGSTNDRRKGCKFPCNLMRRTQYHSRTSLSLSTNRGARSSFRAALPAARHAPQYSTSIHRDAAISPQSPYNANTSPPPPPTSNVIPNLTPPAQRSQILTNPTVSPPSKTPSNHPPANARPPSTPKMLTPHPHPGRMRQATA